MLNWAPLIARGWRVALGSFAALALLLGTAAGAQAAVTQSSITSPADPFFGFNQGQTQSVTISGTSNGNSADTVDIVCYVDDGTSGNPQFTVAPNVPIGNDGTFTTSVPIADLVFSTQEFTSGYCRLRAVPGGTTPSSGLNSFAGPRVLVGHLQEFMNAAGLEDYYAVDPQLTASDDFNSFGDFGIADSYLFDPSVTGQLDSTGFFGNDFPEVEAASDGSQAGVEVDGHPAYPPDLTGFINSGATGIQPLQLNSITQNTSNGDLTIVETDPLESCSGNPFPPNSGNCTSFVPSGVELQRTMTQTDDGHIVYIEDAYSSTDGASHTVGLLLENDQFFESPGSPFGATSNISYEFPGQLAFSTHVAGDHVSTSAPAPASILIENNAEPDGSTAGARGAITYGQAPSGPFAFTTSTSQSQGDVVFDAPNKIMVPATGSVPIRYAYSTEYRLAAVQQDALTAEDHFQAAMVSFDSPSNGATVTSSPVTVTGSVSAGSGVQSVTVNGVKATVSGGSFSVSVPVTAGANTLTAVMTSNGGANASASENVNFAVAPNATTGTASAITATSAALAGSVTPGTAETSYQFRYGTTIAHGISSTAGSLGASSSSSAVNAAITGLSPNTTYHFQLVASSVAGKSEGKDVTFHTPRAAPKRVSDSVKPHADTKVPFKYRFNGSIVRPAGVAASAACRGTVSVTVKHGQHKLISRRAKVNGKCKFSGKVTFRGKKLHGNGKLSFSFHFGGNAALTAKDGKSVTARFG
jgi:hypothetical protein